MEVRWFREDWSKVVHLYRKGQDSPESQIAQYSGRTELFKDSFPYGNVSLLLKKVTVRDAGRYKCFVVSKALDEEGSLQLQVASMGQPPTMKMVGYEGNRILVGCVSEKWFPRPQVMWRDTAGQRISAHKESEVADDAGLLRVESVIAVSHATPGVYSCVIQNPLLGREYEGRLEIPGMFTLCSALANVTDGVTHLGGSDTGFEGGAEEGH
ncbi:butyrophilin-like protein 8 [Hypanus sabinus]|uniref:butyrophilin-like protein 8 n=1 Tax=Hypanus sabinus TaxID=79690 RepID=UPI0028C411DB|nr:butyrophilin-like protein 8 [Hypanus sabinus]